MLIRKYRRPLRGTRPGTSILFAVLFPSWPSRHLPTNLSGIVFLLALAFGISWEQKKRETRGRKRSIVVVVVATTIMDSHEKATKAPRDLLNLFSTITRCWQWGSSVFISLSVNLLFHQTRIYSSRVKAIQPLVSTYTP